MRNEIIAVSKLPNGQFILYGPYDEDTGALEIARSRAPGNQAEFGTVTRFISLEAAFRFASYLDRAEPMTGEVIQTVSDYIQAHSDPETGLLNALDCVIEALDKIDEVEAGLKVEDEDTIFTKTASKLRALCYRVMKGDW